MGQPISTLLIVAAATCQLSADDTDNRFKRPPSLAMDKTVDYVAWYNEFGLRGRDPKSNAYPHYYKIYPLEEETAHVESMIDGVSRCQFGPWTASDAPELNAYLNRNNEFIEIFRAGTRCDYYWKCHANPNESIFDSLNPVPGSCRDISRLLVIDGWRLGPDQEQRLLNNWRDIFRCANHLQTGTQIECLTSQAIRRFAYDQMLIVLHQGVIPNLDASDLESTIRRYDTAGHSLKKAITAEWAMALDSMQRSIGDGEIEKLILPQNRVEKLTRTVVAKWIETLDRDYATVVSLVDGDLSLEKLRTLRAFEPTKADVNQRLLFSIACPAIIRAYELSIRSAAQRKGTLLVLAIHDFKAKTSRWPTSLGELSTVDIHELRIDPYSEKDFRYAIRENGFTLYSVGADGKDDKGRHDTKWGESEGGGDYVFWPVQDTPSPTTKPRGE